MRNKNFAAAVLAYSIAVLAALAGCKQGQTLTTGDTLETVELEDIYGHTVTLPSDIQGKVAVVRFWSIECPSCCKELIKAFEGLYQKYKTQGLAVVTINVHKTPNTLDEFRKLGGVSYPLLIDPYSKVARRFGVTGLPTTFIVDGKGVVREKIVGDIDLKAFEKLITQVLNEGGTDDRAD